jgi:preprotein translocase subunit SecA
LSLEDDLLRVFGKGLGRFAMNQLEEGEALEAGMLTRAIARAQQARENMGFEQRKQLAKFDGVLADQRAAVYKLRNQMLTEDTRELLATWGESQFQVAAHHALPKDQMLEEVAVEDVYTAFRTELSWTPDIHQIAHLLEHSEDTAAVARELHAAWAPHFESQLDVAEAMTGGKLHLVGLTALDKLWRAQLTQLDQLREGIHLRSYAQKDPQREYYEEAGRLFESMALALHREAMELLAGALVAQQEQVAPQPLPVAAPRQEAGPSYRRNRACECGSGQRFKNCCGNLRVTPELEVLPGMVMGMNMTFRPRG